MTDIIYPSAKLNGTTTTTTYPPPKSHLYNPTRHPYRPLPNQNRRRPSRRCCLCLCCFWSILLLTALVLLAAIAGCVVYVLYNPRRPAFSVASLKFIQFNLSASAADDTTRLTSTLNITITTKNPNKKLIYLYDSFAITAVLNQVVIANGSFPSFISNPKNVTAIRSTLSTSAETVTDSASSRRLDLKRRNGLPMKISMDTNVVVKLEKMKSKKLGIRVTCDNIHGAVLKGKTPSVASTSSAKCKVDLRIKIWNWTF